MYHCELRTTIMHSIILLCISSLLLLSTAHAQFNDTILLSNPQLTLTWNASTYSLLQYTSIINTATPGDEGQVNFLNVSQDDTSVWWQMYVTIPSPTHGRRGAPSSSQSSQIFLLSPTTPFLSRSYTVTQSLDQSYTNVTFLYQFDVTPPGTSGLQNSVSVSIDAQLYATSSNVLFYMHISKDTDEGQGPDFAVGLLNATICLHGIDPLAYQTPNDGSSLTNDLLVLPAGFGMMIRDPIDTFQDRYSAHYPNSDATYQQVMWYFNSTSLESGLANGPGLYVETHDSLGSLKIIQYELTPGLSVDDGDTQTFDLSVTVYPLNSGLDLDQSVSPSNNNLIVSYPIVWGVFQGDWFDGIQSYRQWAHGESAPTSAGPSSASWLSAGTMESRLATDTPDYLKNMNFWLNTGWQQLDIFNRSEGDPAVVVDRMTTMMSALSLSSPVGLHWYEWDLIHFDTGYPEYFPVKPGFAAAVAQLHENYGELLKLAPYINGRIYDIHTHSWSNDKASLYAAKTVSQGYNTTDEHLFIETYGSGATFAVMCPATGYWQDKLVDVVTQLTSPTYGLDGIYIDQIGSSETVQCADPTHDHSIADGSSWITGYRTMLKKIQSSSAGPTNNNSFIITESNAESYMNSIHVYLTLVAFRINQTGPYQQLLPIFPTIYGGYYMAMGAEYYLTDLLPDPNVFVAKLTWQFHSGVMMGWLSLGGTNVEPKMGLYDELSTQINSTSGLKYQPEFDWIGELDKFRTQTQKFLVNGRRMRDVPYQYVVNTTLPSAKEIDQTVYSHPHHPLMHRATRPRTSSQAAPHTSHDRHHSRNLLESGPFLYSPIQSSVWIDSTTSNLGLFFSCDTNPSTSSPTTAYQLTIPSFNLANFGLPSNLVNGYWNLLSYDSAGELLDQQQFTSGQNISYQVVIQCRQMIYLELESTESANSFANVADQ